jgi:GT2 family glycosyltransferase
VTQPAPFVSVIIPTHGRADSLARLLERLAQLEYPRDRLEIIVVGDQPSAGPLITKPAEGWRFMTPAADPTGGKSASIKRNAGAAAARGEILAFTDDDCLPSPGWIAAAVPHFAGGSSADSADDKTVYFSSDLNESGKSSKSADPSSLPPVGGVEGRTAPPPQAVDTIHYRQTLHLDHPGGFPSCNMFYLKKAFDEAGGFDPALPYYKEDSDLGFTVLEKGWRIAHEPAAFVEHPARQSAPWNVFAMAAKAVYDPLLYKKHRRLYRRNIGSPITHSEKACVIAGLHTIGFAFFDWRFSAAAGAVYFLIFAARLVKNVWGARFSAMDFIGTAIGLFLSPWVKLVQLARGNLRYRAFLWF